MMRLIFFLTLGLICFFVILVLPAQAESEPLQVKGKSPQELVDRLYEVIRKAERNRTADPSLLQELHDLVRLYDWPWRVELLYDDFRDGNYTNNPIWVVNRGDFRISRELGLRTQFVPPEDMSRGSSEREGEDLKTAILGAVLSELQKKDGGSAQLSASNASEIYTKLRISNAFAAKLQITSQGSKGGGGLFEFGPFYGEQRDESYRLVYNPGQKPAFELMRHSSGRSAVIEAYNQMVQLEDGNIHVLEWRRNSDGEMVVLLDGRELMWATDRTFRNSFDGFTIVNRGGDYSLRQIEIFGTGRGNQ